LYGDYDRDGYQVKFETLDHNLNCTLFEHRYVKIVKH